MVVGGISWRHAPHLLGAEPHHVVVVVRLVGDVARDVLLLEAADAVLEARRARAHPRPRQRGRLARYGKNPSGSVRKRTGMSGRFFGSGISQGSEPFARYPSESTMTGTMYLIAIRIAS